MPAGDVGEEATAYREVTLASEIARELVLAGFINASEAGDIGGMCLDEGVLEAAGFEAFASFRTNREKYRYIRACWWCWRAAWVRHTNLQQFAYNRRGQTTLSIFDGDDDGGGMYSWCDAIGISEFPAKNRFVRAAPA